MVWRRDGELSTSSESGGGPMLHRPQRQRCRPFPDRGAVLGFGSVAEGDEWKICCKGLGWRHWCCWP